jgi:hypothetical protein
MLKWVLALLCALVPVSALPPTPVVQSQAPPLPAPAQTPPAPEKIPAISETQFLKIQNAQLLANLTQAQYQKAMAGFAETIKKEVADYEAAHPGFTIDTVKLIAIKKLVKTDGK